MTLEILKFPDPRLAQVSQPVTEFNASLHRLLDAMAKTMYEANGIGLAAPQVNHFIRVFVIDLLTEDGKPDVLYEFINPKLSNGSGQVIYEEGCLSVPGLTEEVKRKEAITVEYQDRHGKKHLMEAQDLLAVAMQHENDHLDGVLFVDRLPPIKRRMVKRKLLKAVTL